MRCPHLFSLPHQKWRYFRVFVAVCGAVAILQFLFFARPHSFWDAAPQHLTDLQPEDQAHANKAVLHEDWNPDPDNLFFAHGSIPCLPKISNDLIVKAKSIRKSCNIKSPFDLTRPSARIGVITAHFGDDDDCQAALETYLLHGLVHGHEVHVLCNPIVDAMWNKPAFVLKVMMEEMLRPESVRMQWSMWADGDTVLLDQCRPISTFLPSPRPHRSPPATEDQRYGFGILKEIGSLLRASRSSWERAKKDIHLIISNDKNGLNAGVFLLRVSPLSISLMTAILSYPTFRPTARLRFSEQTAMDLLISSSTFKAHTQRVPQHWFNSYTYTDRDAKGNNLGYGSTWVAGDIDSGASVFADKQSLTGLTGGFREGYVRRGDFLVHFAGNVNKKKDVHRWIKMLDQEGIIWEKKGAVQRDLSKEVKEFWRRLGY